MIEQNPSNQYRIITLGYFAVLMPTVLVSNINIEKLRQTKINTDSQKQWLTISIKIETEKRCTYIREIQKMRSLID